MEAAGPLITCTAVGLLPVRMSCMNTCRCVVVPPPSAAAAAARTDDVDVGARRKRRTAAAAREVLETRKVLET
jgi:hypothetical protein